MRIEEVTIDGYKFIEVESDGKRVRVGPKKDYFQFSNMGVESIIDFRPSDIVDSEGSFPGCLLIRNIQKSGRSDFKYTCQILCILEIDGRYESTSFKWDVGFNDLGVLVSNKGFQEHILPELTDELLGIEGERWTIQTNDTEWDDPSGFSSFEGGEVDTILAPIGAKNMSFTKFEDGVPVVKALYFSRVADGIPEATIVEVKGPLEDIQKSDVLAIKRLKVSKTELDPGETYGDYDDDYEFEDETEWFEIFAIFTDKGTVIVKWKYADNLQNSFKTSDPVSPIKIKL